MLLFIDGFNRIGFRKYFLICIKNIILSDQLWGGFLFRSLVWLKTKQIRELFLLAYLSSLRLTAFDIFLEPSPAAPASP